MLSDLDCSEEKTLPSRSNDTTKSFFGSLLGFLGKVPQWLMNCFRAGPTWWPQNVEVNVTLGAVVINIGKKA